MTAIRTRSRNGGSRRSLILALPTSKTSRTLERNGNYRKALTMVEAPYVVIMGANDIMLPNYLDVVVDGFEDLPDASVVQPGVQVIDEKGIACIPSAGRGQEGVRAEDPPADRAQRRGDGDQPRTC